MKQLAIILFATALDGCSNSGIWTRKDSWYWGEPEGVNTYNWKRLSDECFYQVLEGHQEEAQRLLVDTAAIGITPERAQELVGRPLAPAYGTTPFLVRAVTLDPGNGGFHVSTDQGRLLIGYSIFGRAPAPMRRHALVLQLERMPIEVFVTCWMAE